MMADPLPAPSPSQTVGPFFHDALITADGHVLVDDRTRGERIRITGRILDGDGVPVDDALVEIWQPDANGVFPHPSDPRAQEADPHFRGFGRSDTAEGGHFRFDTVKPGRRNSDVDPRVAPFVSVRIFSRGLLRDLVTRIYFPEDRPETDPVLGRIAPGRRQTLIARREDAPDLTTYHFDVRLQGRDETVFFDPGTAP